MGKQLKKNQPKKDLPEETMRKVWFASLGALSILQKQAGSVLEGMISEGQSFHFKYQRILAPGDRRIIAPPHADLLKAETLIEGDRLRVRRPYFQQQSRRACRACGSDDLPQQAGAMSVPMMAPVDADDQQMRLVDNGHDHGKADDVAAQPENPHLVAGHERIGKIAARPRKILQ